MRNQIIIEDPSGNKSSIELNGVVKYTKRLNLVSEGAFNIYVPQSKRSLFQTNSKIYIYRNGVLDWKGIITQLEKFSGGQIGGYIKGYEIKLAHENGSYPNSPYTSTNSSVIASDIISESSFFNAGTIDSSFTIDFRIYPSSSLLNALQNLIKKTQQDLEIVYSDSGNDTIGVVNHLGKTTPDIVLNDNREIINPEVSEALPLGNYVIVYGKGDGEFQYKAEASDSTSIAQYGKIVYVYNDPTIISEAEAQAMANALLERYKNPQKHYTFEVVNPDLDISLGDLVFINAPDLDLNSQEVRITSIERKIFSDKEMLSIQVSDTAERYALRKIAELNAERELTNRDLITYPQGSGNTISWSGMLNAKSGVPFTLTFQIPDDFVKDESGNLKISSFILDYDVDEYRKDVGFASFTGSDPPVRDSSDYVSPSVSGYSGRTAPSVSGLTDTNTSPGTSDYVDAGLLLASPSSSFKTIATFYNVSGAFSLITISLHIDQSSSGDDIWFRVYDSDTRKYYPNSNGIHLYTYSGFEYVTLNIVVNDNISYDDLRIQYVSDTAFDAYIYLTATDTHEHYSGSLSADSHNHSSNTYTAESHAHPAGTYKIYSSDLDQIIIGDDVNDAGVVNATSVDIYLDYWNGTSWVNKYSILNTGKTLDTNVDLSNGGQYPDNTGFWRVRIEPNSSNPDLIKAGITLKHLLKG